MDCIYIILSLITIALFWIIYELYYKIKSKRQNKKYIDIINKSNINKSKSDNEIPGSWEFVTLGWYLDFYKIKNPTKEQVCKIIGHINDETYSQLKEDKINDIYHSLYYAIKTKPMSDKKQEKYTYHFDENLENYGFKNTGSYFFSFYILDLSNSYLGDEQKLEFYKRELTKGNLEYLPFVIATIFQEEGGIYREEFVDKRANFFKKWLSVKTAMTIYKYFVGFEYADIDKIHYVDTEDQKRRISQEVKDAVWRRTKGKCEKCGSQNNLEFDHIVPFSKGGSNTYRNVQLLCEKCNREKSDKIG